MPGQRHKQGPSRHARTGYVSTVSNSKKQGVRILVDFRRATLDSLQSPEGNSVAPFTGASVRRPSDAWWPGKRALKGRLRCVETEFEYLRATSETDSETVVLREDEVILTEEVGVP